MTLRDVSLNIAALACRGDFSAETCWLEALLLSWSPTTQALVCPVGGSQNRLLWSPTVQRWLVARLLGAVDDRGLQYRLPARAEDCVFSLNILLIGIIYFYKLNYWHKNEYRSL